MALDVDTTKIGRRSSRLGFGPRKAFKGRHSSRGVLPLNQGSSPLGSKNVLSLGGKGGSFGSGRPAGGGGGAALLAALAPAASIAGPPPEVGPPPVEHPLVSSLLEAPIRSWPSLAPTPSEQAAPDWSGRTGAAAAGGFGIDQPLSAIVPGYPKFAPTPDDDAPWFQLGRRWAR